MKTVFIIIGVLLLILGIGFVVTNSQNKTDQPQPVTENETNSTGTETEPTESERNTPGVKEASGTDTESSGTYNDYDANKIAQSDAEHIVLFFHATWCPSCRALENNIKANLDNIPADVEIYKVDFDVATELKRKLGVTIQHSVLEIDSEGNTESNITHPLTLSSLINNL